MTICPRATVPTNSQSASINTETVTTSSGPTRHFSFGCRPAAINPASEPPRRNSLNSNTSRRIFPAWCELKVKSNSGGTSSMWVRPLADWKSPTVRLPRMAALTCSLVGRKLVTLICAGLQKTSVTAFASPVEPQTPQSKECTFLKEKLWLLLAETAAELKHQTEQMEGHPELSERGASDRNFVVGSDPNKCIILSNPKALSNKTTFTPPGRLNKLQILDNQRQ
jgi:hypothetical protein